DGRECQRRLALDEVRNSADTGTRRGLDCELLVDRGTDRFPEPVDLYGLKARGHRAHKSRRVGIFRKRDPDKCGQSRSDRYRDGRSIVGWIEFEKERGPSTLTPHRAYRTGRGGCGGCSLVVLRQILFRDRA